MNRHPPSAIRHPRARRIGVRAHTLAVALLGALGGYGQKEDRARSIQAGFHHHFVKPADPRIIQAAIAGWSGADREQPSVSRAEPAA